MKRIKINIWKIHYKKIPGKFVKEGKYVKSNKPACMKAVV